MLQHAELKLPSELKAIHPGSPPSLADLLLAAP